MNYSRFSRSFHLHFPIFPAISFFTFTVITSSISSSSTFPLPLSFPFHHLSRSTCLSSSLYRSSSPLPFLLISLSLPFLLSISFTILRSPLLTSTLSSVYQCRLTSKQYHAISFPLGLWFIFSGLSVFHTSRCLLLFPLPLMPCSYASVFGFLLPCYSLFFS